MRNDTMRIMGIDPGLAITGYGLLELHNSTLHLVEAGVVRTKPKAAVEQRLADIFNEISDVLTEFSPQSMAVEDLYAHYAQHRTAIIMGHARGVIFLTAARQNIPVTSYNATRIKKTVTGNGRATKEQVQRMVMERLCLKTIPQPPDVSDALAAAICHAENI